MPARRLLALPYQLSRMPLSLLDVQLARHLPETSLPRLAFDVGLGSLDNVAGRLLLNRALARVGADRVQRASALGGHEASRWAERLR